MTAVAAALARIQGKVTAAARLGLNVGVLLLQSQQPAPTSGSASVMILKVDVRTKIGFKPLLQHLPRVILFAALAALVPSGHAAR
jgi:hypothetical protein